MDVLGQQLSVVSDAGEPAPQLVTTNAKPVEPLFRPEQVLGPLLNDQVFRGEALNATQGPVEICVLVSNATVLANVTLNNRASSLYSASNSLAGARLNVYDGDSTTPYYSSRVVFDVGSETHAILPGLPASTISSGAMASASAGLTTNVYFLAYTIIWNESGSPQNRVGNLSLPSDIPIVGVFETIAITPDTAAGTLAFTLTLEMYDARVTETISGMPYTSSVQLQFKIVDLIDRIRSTYSFELITNYPSGEASVPIIQAASSLGLTGSVGLYVNTTAHIFNIISTQYCVPFSELRSLSAPLGTQLSYELSSASGQVGSFCAKGTFDLQAFYQAKSLAVNYNVDRVESSAPSTTSNDGVTRKSNDIPVIAPRLNAMVAIMSVVDTGVTQNTLATLADGTGLDGFTLNVGVATTARPIQQKASSQLVLDVASLMALAVEIEAQSFTTFNGTSSLATIPGSIVLQLNPEGALSSLVTTGGIGSQVVSTLEGGIVLAYRVNLANLMQEGGLSVGPAYRSDQVDFVYDLLPADVPSSNGSIRHNVSLGHLFQVRNATNIPDAGLLLFDYNITFATGQTVRSGFALPYVMPVVGAGPAQGHLRIILDSIGNNVTTHLLAAPAALGNGNVTLIPPSAITLIPIVTRKPLVTVVFIRRTSRPETVYMTPVTPTPSLPTSRAAANDRENSTDDGGNTQRVGIIAGAVVGGVLAAVTGVAAIAYIHRQVKGRQAKVQEKYGFVGQLAEEKRRDLERMADLL
jgi:hypothetical protein